VDVPLILNQRDLDTDIHLKLQVTLEMETASRKIKGKKSRVSKRGSMKFKMQILSHSQNYLFLPLCKGKNV